MYAPRLLINYPLPPGAPKSVAATYHAGPQHCTTDDTAGYLPDMPTSPNLLRAYLLKPLHFPAGDPVDGGTLMQVVENDWLTAHFLLPQQQAALYELLAHTTGLALAPHVTNAQGPRESASAATIRRALTRSSSTPRPTRRSA